MGAKDKEVIPPHSPPPLSKKQKIKVRGFLTPSAALLLYFASPPPFLPTPNPPSRYVIIIPAMMAIATTIING